MERVDSGIDKLSLNNEDVLPEATTEHHEISRKQRVLIKRYQGDQESFHACKLGHVVRQADGKSIVLARMSSIVDKQLDPASGPPMRPRVGSYPNPPMGQAVQSVRMQGLLSGLSRLETKFEPMAASHESSPKPEWWMSDDEIALMSPHTAARTHFIQEAMLEAERLGMEPGDYLRQLDPEKVMGCRT